MYKNVLIALNDSPAAERALHRAIALAEVDNGDLFVVSIDEGLPVFESIVWAAVSDNLAKILEEDRKNLYRHLLDDAQKQAQSHSIHLHSTLAGVSRRIAFWKLFSKYMQTFSFSESLLTSGLAA
jgi:nucleotide-binding universal stress UspA family protein